MTPSRHHAIASAGGFPRGRSGTGPGLRRTAFLAALALSGALCGLLVPAGARAQDPFNPRCPGFFEIYEAASRMTGAMGNQPRMTTSSQVREAARLLRMGDCLTFTDQLAPLATLGPEAGARARANSGPSIPPTSAHIGIVTSMADEARVIDFFAARGIRARGLGAPYLGRRIYLGPFVTAGALEGAMTLARDAGFAYPYPANF